MLKPLSVELFSGIFFCKIQISKKHFSSSPCKSIFPHFLVKGTVGIGFQFLTGKEGKPVFPDFGKRGDGGVLVERAAELAFITAENKRRPCDDFFLFFSQRFLFLRQVGFAVPYIEGILADDVARAVVEALPAFAAGKIERGIRRKLKGRQYGSDGEEGAVLWIDDAVIFPKNPSPAA